MSGSSVSGSSVSAPVEEKMPPPATAKSAMRQSLDAAWADLKDVHTQMHEHAKKVALAELKEVHKQMVIHEHAKKVALSRVRELEEEVAKTRKRYAEKMQQEQEVAKKRKLEEQEAEAEAETIRNYCNYFNRTLYMRSVSSVVASAAAVHYTADDRSDSITKKLRDDMVLDIIRVVAREKKPAAAVTKP